MCCGRRTARSGSISAASPSRWTAGAPVPSPAPRSAPRQDLLAEFASPLQTDTTPRERGHGAVRLNQLRQVTIHDAAVTVTDRRLGADWRMAPATLDLTRQEAGGVTGSAAADLALGGGPALHATAEFHLQSGGAATEITAHVSPFAPAGLAGAAPALHQAAGFAAPVEASLSLALGPDLAPLHFALQARAGAGPVRLGGFAAALSSASLDAAGGPDSAELRTLQIVLAQPDGSIGPTVALHGDGKRSNGRFIAHFAIDLDQVAFVDLPHLWPAGIGGGARPWITQNITAGTAHDGHVAVTLEGPADLSEAKLTAASGSLAGSDLTVHWLRPLPPIEHAAATLTLTGPDTLEIAAQGGHVAIGKDGITLHDGSMKISGLTVKDQYGSIALTAGGALPDVLALLASKRLHLLSAHPLPLTNPAGTFTTDLTVQLPLDNRVTMDQIAIRAHAKLAQVHLGKVALGHDIDGGTFDLTADNDGLKASGTGRFARIPTSVAVALDFRAGPPDGITTRVDASGTASDSELANLGLDTGGVLSGPAQIHAVYAEQRAGPASVQLDADLRGASLDAGQIGWKKAPGQPATAHALLRLDHDRLAGIDDVVVNGPDLAVQGSADMADGRPQTLVLNRAVIGRTDLAGTIRLASRPGEPIRVDLAGPQIDLTGQLGKRAGKRPSHPVEHVGPPWQLRGRFDKVVLAGNHVVGPMTAVAESDGRVIRSARVQVTGGVSMLGTITTTNADGRVLSITADDAGALLQALDIVDTIRGGRLVLTGRFDDRNVDHRLNGNADISNFRLTNAPAITRVLEAMTLYGMLGMLRGPGMEVDRLIAPFGLDQQRLTLDDARAYNSALGVTAKGTVDLDGNTADLTGTIVPAYLFNSFLGNIPVIGRLFSPEQGGGVFSATYTVRGSLGDPAVSVNPLAALAPGFLRGVFGIFQKR